MSNFVKNKWTQFKADTRGNFVMIAAIALPVAAFTIGSTVDLANFRIASHATQAAVDSASIAASRAITVEDATLAEATEIARQQLSLNISNVSFVNHQEIENSLRIEQDLDTGTITASADVQTPTLFAAIFGHDNIAGTVTSTNQVEILEVSFVLDTTGSMRNSIDGTQDDSGERILALQTAMRNTIDQLIPNNVVNDQRVRVSLVPYIDGVNLGPFYQAAVGNNAPTSANTCVNERETLNTFEDVAPIQSDNSTLFETDATLLEIPQATLLDIVNDGFGAGDNTIPCPFVEIVPLTSDRQVLLDAVNLFQPDGFTAGHNGINWGFNTLSAEWRDFWPEGAQPALYGTPNVRKILVVMTDGQFNTSYRDNVTRGIRENARGKAAARNSSEADTIEFCDLAKTPTNNISVYTITFGATARAQDLMRDCASNENNALIADSAEQLQEAFDTILREARTPLLTN